MAKLLTRAASRSVLNIREMAARGLVRKIALAKAMPVKAGDGRVVAAEPKTSQIDGRQSSLRPRAQQRQSIVKISQNGS